MKISEVIAEDGFMAYVQRAWRWRARWLEVRNTVEQWPFLRELYAEITPEIHAGKRQSPYVIDWDFTPIELDLWCSIRQLGLPFWPQYPVGRYFVDFGDPVMKIALECDGARYHNARDDAIRDAQINELGWKVFRYQGWQCVRGEGDERSAHEKLLIDLWPFYPRVREYMKDREDGEG